MLESVQSPYPNGCRSAVSLTFDDGNLSQWEIAVPILNNRNLLSTFYLPTVDSAPGYDHWTDILKSWKEVAEQGHEIGNHTRSHRFSRAFGESLDEGTYLETMTLQDIEADIMEAERRLDEVFGHSQRTFAYPCYHDYIGEGLTRQSYVPFIAKNFVAARSRGEFANYPLTCSLSYLWSYPVEHMSGAAMIKLIEQARSLGQWCILAIHGIDAGKLAITSKDFLEVCDYLKQNRSDTWVAPVIEVARRIIDWRSSLIP